MINHISAEPGLGSVGGRTGSGVGAGFAPDPFPEFGQCVHKIARHDGAPFDATSAMRVPAGKEHLLKPGARVPVAYLVEDPTGTATIDWSRA